MILRDYEYIYGMATPFKYFIDEQGTFGAGSVDLITAPSGQYYLVSQLKFSNASAYDLSIDIVRANPASTLNVYSFTLNAGDVVIDANGYRLGPGDKISVTTSAANTNYFVTGTFSAIPKQP